MAAARPAPPEVGDGARTLIVGVAFALAAAAVLYVGTDRWALLPGAAAVAGVIAGLVQFGRPGLGGWWAALMLYAVLFWVTFVLPWLYPRPRPPYPGPSATPADAAPRADRSDRVNR